MADEWSGVLQIADCRRQPITTSPFIGAAGFAGVWDMAKEANQSLQGGLESPTNRPVYTGRGRSWPERHNGL